MNDQKQHARPPRLCADCEAVAIQRAGGVPGNWIMRWCQHNHVLAVGFTKGGVITSWQLQGPMSEHEAEKMALKVVAATKPAHAAPPRLN